ncbi:tetratricopeptide repeat protein [Micromonospora sp. WMMD998]|uniref:tetratricopeptide repeat protein n=1 Tax=Micromonospora sp. WMMD998 TaxID=3016092 RepID=UPI00249BEFF9|nr:tetratricopeptide repeat protein [Micromonospora sp. WMMD998]WFE37617.1 tetratricopeptide repeat protein [Micromonospora sp. WMMD998]
MFGRRRKRETPSESQFSIMPLPSQTAARQAASGGDPVEMNRLGNRLKLDGKIDEAAEWYRRAAEAGNSDAAANLATTLMSQGRNKEAAQWFRRAGGPLGEALAHRLENEPDGPPSR